ncbi:terminase [Leuconostoc mesenteroides]|uniref:terminase small subunit n=1 Tax=Leuconostoc mesenteroides TaxID=1245 RepID=UPI00123B5801|nr:terminase small subunit [Leuconostoc mesenteroides]KAA8346326.1 terminase [Leuconostoc mesenteroides]
MKKYEEAEQDYLSGLKYKDIAKKYGVSISTVKSWKSRYWKSDDVATKDKKVAQVAKPKPTEKAIDELSDSELTDKQKAFVLEYLCISNATQAYINVYDVDRKTALANGPRLLGNARIQNKIKCLHKAKLQELGVDVFDLMEDVVKEARADLGDVIDFGSYEELASDSDGGVLLDTEDNPITYRRSWVKLKAETDVLVEKSKNTKSADKSLSDMFNNMFDE